MTLYQAIYNLLNGENVNESIKTIKEFNEVDLNLLKKSIDDFEFNHALDFKTKTIEVIMSLIRLSSQDGLTKVDRLILESQIIPAIKEYRHLTGLGLRESKDYVDRRRECLLNQK